MPTTCQTPKARSFIWWSDEQRSTLARLWAENLTGRRIAAEMGLTRNQVLAMARRLHLPSRVKDWPMIEKLAQAKRENAKAIYYGFDRANFGLAIG